MPVGEAFSPTGRPSFGRITHPTDGEREWVKQTQGSVKERRA
jgi:hypothetical protein